MVTSTMMGKNIGEMMPIVIDTLNGKIQFIKPAQKNGAILTWGGFH